MIQPDKEYGVVANPKTREYVRWVRVEGESMPYFAIRDCYQYMGIKRVDVPRGSRIRARARGTKLNTFWKEDYARSGTELIMGIRASHVRFLGNALKPESAMSISGGMERLCYFLIKHHPLLLLDTAFISPQKSDSQRYI